MPTKIATAPSSSGDALGVDDNYQAYVYDPIEDEWVPGTVFEQRKREREARAEAQQPPPPPANPDQPPAPPARPDVSIANPEADDTAARLSAATVAKPKGGLLGAVDEAAPAAPNATNDQLTSDRELEGQGQSPNRTTVPFTYNGTPGAAKVVPFSQLPSQQAAAAQAKDRAASEAEAAGQTAPGQTVPSDLAEKTGMAGGVDNGQQWADPYSVGPIYNGPTGMRPPQNEREMALARGDISSDSNLLESKIGQAATDLSNTNVPVLSPAARYVKNKALSAVDTVAPALKTIVNTQAGPLTEVSRLPDLLGIHAPTPGDVAVEGAKQIAGAIPTTLGGFATTLPVAEIATGTGRLGSKLAGAAARDLAESETAQRAAQAAREALLRGEEGAARLPRPGGGTAREAAAQRAIENRNLGGAGVQVDNRAMREAAPLSEEMAALGEGVQLNPASLGLEEDRAAITNAIKVIRQNPAGQTAELGRLEAQLEALDIIANHDAAGAFQMIADRFSSLKATSPKFQAERDELGRIHSAMLDAEDPGRFAPEALKEPPAGATFDPITHEIRAPGASNPDLQLQAPSTLATANQAPEPALPGMEAASGVPLRRPTPVLGSMRSDEEIFRGEQGGLQAGLPGTGAETSAKYQPGLAESLTPAEVADIAPAGAPAKDISELDQLLAKYDRMKQALGVNFGRISSEGQRDLERRIVELGSKTPYDDAEVIIARAENMAKNVPETPELHQQWVQELRNQGGLAHPEPGDVVPIQRDRIAHIVLGPPAAGKNTATANPLRKQFGAMLIDSDEAKEMIPGFGGGRFAGAVHVESDKLAAQLYGDSLGLGENMVIPLVGKNQGKIDLLGQQLKDAGYDVRLHYVDLPEDKAAERAVERFHRTGRFVDPDYVLNQVDGNPRRTFEEMKGRDWASGYERKSNDVARGQAPVTLESTLDRPAAEASAGGPGVDDAGRALGGGPEGANAASRTPVRLNPDEPIPGLAESLAPENQAAIQARSDVLRSQGQGAADAAAVNRPTTAAPAPVAPREAPETGPYVRQPDGTTVEATADSINAGVKRVMVRQSGIRIPTGATPDEAIAIIRKAVKEARTVGGRSLFGPGTDEDLVDEVINKQILDGRVRIAKTGGRGRIAATFVGNDEEGALGKAMEEAGTHRPEAGVENALSDEGAGRGGRNPPPPPANQGAMLPGEGPNEASWQGVPPEAQAEWDRLQRPGELPRAEGANEASWQGVPPEAADEWTRLQREGERQRSQQRLQEGLARTRQATMQTPDFAPEGRGGAGGGAPRPPAGGEGQASFPWKPGQSLGRRLLKAGADLLFGVPRALKFGLDQSAPLRQGLWDLISHPAITVAGAPERYLEHGGANPAFGRGQGKMLADIAAHPAREATNIITSLYHADGALVQQWKAFTNAILHGTPQETERVYANIGRRYADLKAGYTDAAGHELPGLYKAERGAKATLSNREEQVATSILDHVPGLRRLMNASEDSFAMFLSKQRDDIFDNWADTYVRLTGQYPSRQEANDVARWINIKSGRGELPQNWANAFTVPFTAPRLYASQLERLPVMAPFMLRSGEVRKQMMGDWVKVFGALSASVAMASEFGLGSVDVDTSHPSADFLKIRIGNHRIDPWGGYAQLARLTARLISGTRSTAGVTYDSTWREELTNFALSKLAPTAALANDIISGHDFNHNELGWDWDSVKREVANTYAPLLFQDLVQGFQDDGLRGLAITAPSFFGLSVSTYPPGLTERRQKAAQAAGYPSFREAPLSVQNDINAQPDIKALADQQPPSPYKVAKEKTYAPIQAEQDKAEASFKAGTNDTLIQDLWHDQNKERQGARAALEAAFTSTFNKTEKTQFDRALDGYWALDKQRPDGSPDYEATDAARQDYLAKLPKVQQDWINDFLDTTAQNQSPLRQQYFKYLDDRKAAGYFDLDPKDKGYAAKLAALDKANPDLDVQNWYWKHTTAADVRLNSPEAVDKALAMLADNPGRTVKANLDGVGSVSRPINGNEQAWNDTKATLQKFADAKTKFEKQEQQRLIASGSPNAASYNKPWAQLTADQQSTIHANIAKSLQVNSPQLDALLAYWGISDTLQSKAAIDEYRKLQAKYGKDPATPTTVVKVAAGAK